MGFSEDIRNGFLDGLVSGTLYIALFTVAPDNDGVGGTEVSAADYDRLEFSDWADAIGGIKRNASTAQWGDAATSVWGTIVCVALYDAPTGGSIVARSDNTLSKAVGLADVPRFLAGEIEINFFNQED